MLAKVVEAKEVAAKKGPDAALRFLAKLPKCLGSYKDAITKAVSAKNSPGFYSDLGQDPDALYAAGLAAMTELFAGE